MKNIYRLGALASVSGLGIGLLFVSAAFAAPLNYNADTAVTIASPSTTITIKSGSRADQVVTNAGNIQVTVSGSETFTVTSTSDVSFAYVSGTSSPYSTSCSSGTVTGVLNGNTGSGVYTITPSGTACVSATVSPGGGSTNTTTTTTTPTTTTTTTTPSTTTGTVAATAAAGGVTTVSTSEGTTAGVTLPANALASDATVTVAPVAKTASTATTAVAAVPTGSQIVGSNVYNYTAATAAGASVSTFSTNVTLSFTYSDAQVSGLDVNSLKVNYFDTAQNKWVALSTTINTTTHTLTAVVNHFTLFAILGTPATTTTTTPTTGTATTTTTTTTTTVTIVDGDVVKTADNPDVYIIKIVGAKKFRRLILNPAIFDSYAQLKWSNIKTVSQDTMNTYTVSTLIMAVHPNGKPVSGRVFSLTAAANSDVGVKHWLNMTPAKFEAGGRDWDSIYKINDIEAGAKFYPTGTSITK